MYWPKYTCSGKNNHGFAFSMACLSVNEEAAIESRVSELPTAITLWHCLGTKYELPVHTKHVPVSVEGAGWGFGVKHNTWKYEHLHVRAYTCHLQSWACTNVNLGNS